MPFRILIVEDDPDINRLLSRILAKAGYDTTSAFSGSEARLLKPRSFDLVLLDLMLPGATGEELIEEIRSHHRHFRQGTGGQTQRPEIRG